MRICKGCSTIDLPKSSFCPFNQVRYYTYAVRLFCPGELRQSSLRAWYLAGALGKGTR